ncbi:MAG: cysteine desulfurase family protein [bacterium]
MLYLDNAATTQVRQEVLDEMLKYFTEEYGNPNSKFYDLAVNATKAVNLAKERVSNLIKCNIDDVIFNSGATEGNNTIIKCIARMLKNKGNHIITTSIEHSSVLDSCKFLEKEGFNVTYLPANNEGNIDINDFKKAITKETILTTVMYVNNEVGSILPINEIGQVCKDKKIFFHTDATQAVGKLKFSFNEIVGLNALTFSGHKIHGPKGIGVLIVKDSYSEYFDHFEPLIHGGGESKFRNGTANVPGIVGIGKASELVENELEESLLKLEQLDSNLIKMLKEKFKDKVIFNNDFDNRIKGIMNVRFLGINNEVLLKTIAPLIGASTGSACSNLSTSHVLSSMGLNSNEIKESVRFSLSCTQSFHELDEIKKL